MSENLFEPQEGQQTDSNAVPNQEQQAPQAQESNQSQTVDTSTLFADQLSGIRDDDGRQKYADVNTALSSIPHAQNHIKSLETQLTQMQEELNKRQGMEQVMERIQATQETNTEQPSVSLDEAQLEAVLERQLNQREQTKAAQTNELKFSNTLREKFGNKAREVLDAKASELGISTEFMQSLAQTSPKAALAYFDEVSTTGPQPTVPSNNAQALTTPPAPNELSNAKAKLFGTANPNIDKWRKAGSNIT